SSIRTVADLSVQPEVVHLDVSDRTAESKRIDLKIEQTARTDDPDSLQVQWADVPGSVDVAAPELVGNPTEIASGVWRVTWQSAVRAKTEPDSEPAEPLRLALVSRQAERLLSRINCTVIVRRSSGVRGPRLVHFGRVPPSAKPMRRIQLQALDGR